MESDRVSRGGPFHLPRWTRGDRGTPAGPAQVHRDEVDATLARLPALMAGEAGLPETMHALLDLALATLPFDRAFVALRDWPQAGLSVAAAAGAIDLEEEAPPLPAHGPLTQIMMLRAEPILIGDVLTDPRAGILRTLPYAAGVRTCALVPLHAADAWVGILALGSPAQGVVLTAEQTAALALITRHLALLVGEARAAAQGRTQARAITTLCQMTEAATEAARLEETALALLRLAVQALAVGRGTVFMVEPEKAQLRAVARYAPRLQQETVDVVPLDSALAVAEVFRTAKPLVSELEKAPALPVSSRRLLARLRVEHFAYLPLVNRGHAIGVLALLGRDQPFTPDDHTLLTAVSRLLAMATHHAAAQSSAEAVTVEAVGALASAIEMRDGYTGAHCTLMATRAVAVAQALGLTTAEVEAVHLGAMLHDIGKLGIPDAILNKPGALSAAELAVIRRHPDLGANIVSQVASLRHVVPIVRHHHERWDGGGYPAGLAREAIPIGARIVATVDTYGAMTEDRVYRRAPGHDVAIAELRRVAGSQLDPQVVEAFVALPRRVIAPDEAGADRRAAARPRPEGTPLALPLASRVLLRELPGLRIGDLAERDYLISPETLTDVLAARFTAEPERQAFVLGENGTPCGLITRQGLLTKLASLYGHALYLRRPAALALEEQPFIVDASVPLEEVARRVTERPAARRYDPIIVTRDEHYLGMVEVMSVLEQINQASLRHARLSNSLTGLPGAALLQAAVRERLGLRQPLAVIYADLDAFKAFNDRYGVARGDDAILLVSRLLSQAAAAAGDDSAVVGHIGGDDFVLLVHPEKADAICRYAVERFDRDIVPLYDAADWQTGGIRAPGRDGHECFHPIMGLSLAVVEAGELPEPSYYALMELAAGRKAGVKQQPGSSWLGPRGGSLEASALSASA